MMSLVPNLKDYLNQMSMHNFIVSPSFTDLKSNEKDVLVSIITVAKNSQNTIEKTISSVINQNYKNIEYIIIDGGSTDETLDIIKKYADSISCCISESDKGISDAFNKGICISTGDVIGLINSDDWYEDNAISKVVERFFDEDIDITHGKLIRWKKDGEAEVSESNEKLLKVDSTVNHPTVFVKRKIYEDIGLFRRDFKYAMDYEWLLRAKINENIRFSYIDSCLANMRLTGISSEYWRKANKEVLRAKNIHNKNISNYLYFYYKLIKGVIEKILSDNGFSWIVASYRKNFSVAKKKNI
jgi:glycosyltransferase involved in cell wall biosynthesis